VKKRSWALLLLVAAATLNRIINSAFTYGNVERLMRQLFGQALPIIVAPA
jgi:hypothetical protein